jgi:hypothetical protein
MSDVWRPWDPEGSRPPAPSGDDQGPDPEPIVRSVRIGFLLAGFLLAAAVNAGLHRVGPGLRVATGLAVTGAFAAAVVALMLWAAWAFRPARLVDLGKRALEVADPRERRPRAERARAMGLRGLAMSWALQAMLFGFVPLLAGLVLNALHRSVWELLAFAAGSILAGLVLQHQVAKAIRRAVGDPVLRERYGDR